MNPVNKGNRNWAFRLLLLIGHFFLFAPHFNYRYYTIANFFVYNSSDSAADNSHVGAHGSELAVDYQAWQQQHVHFSIDKRFRMQVFPQHDFSCSPAPLSYTIARPTFYSSSFVYSSSGPSINILRGPPTA